MVKLMFISLLKFTFLFDFDTSLTDFELQKL